MPSSKTIADVKAAWDEIDKIERYSDRLIGNRFFGVGLDAIVGLIPIIGEIYGIAAAYLISRAAERARVGIGTQFLMTLILAADIVISFIWVAGDAVDFILRGHAIAAYLAQHAIRNTLYIEGTSAQHKNGDSLRRHHMNHPQTPHRTVYLGHAATSEWLRWAAAAVAALFILWIWVELTGK